MSGVQVQRLRPGAGPRLRALRLRALGQAHPALYGDLDEETARPPGHWEELLALPGRATLVAVENGEDVGLLHCGPPTWNTTADPSEFDLGGAWVAPAARGRGAFDALVAAALAHARAGSATAVTLWVYEANHVAARGFARHGFRLSGRKVVADTGVRYLEHRHDLPTDLDVLPDSG